MRAENRLRQSRHRNGIVLCLAPDWTRWEPAPQCGHCGARSADSDEPLLGLSVVRERPHGLDHADALLVCASPVLS